MALTNLNIHIKNYLKDFNKRQTIIITQKKIPLGGVGGFRGHRKVFVFMLQADTFSYRGQIFFLREL